MLPHRSPDSGPQSRQLYSLSPAMWSPPPQHDQRGRTESEQGSDGVSRVPSDGSHRRDGHHPRGHHSAHSAHHHGHHHAHNDQHRHIHGQPSGPPPGTAYLVQPHIHVQQPPPPPTLPSPMVWSQPPPQQMMWSPPQQMYTPSWAAPTPPPSYGEAVAHNPFFPRHDPEVDEPPVIPPVIPDY